MNVEAMGTAVSEDAFSAFFNENPEMIEVTLKQLSSRKFKKGDLAAALHELLETVKKSRRIAKPAPAPEPKPKAQERTLSDVVKAAFPGIGSELLAKIVSMSTMSRQGLVVKFQKKSHREWFQKRHQFNPELAYAAEGLTIKVTKKKH